MLGAASENARANESQKLLNWGYAAFDSVKLFDAEQAVATPEVWKGKAGTVKIGRTTPIVVTVPAGSGGKLSTEVVRQDPLIAPFTKGQAMGTLKVKLGPTPWLKCRWWRLKAWSRQASSAVPGMRSASGSVSPAPVAQALAYRLEGVQLCDLLQAGTVEGFSEFPKGFTFSLFASNSRLGTFINANH